MAASKVFLQRALFAVVATASAAGATAQGTAQLYKQRTADGRIVFSHRPAVGAKTQPT